jgi:hypothetical protein
VQNPVWFRQLKWSKPINVAALNRDRNQIPAFTGCYAFTEGCIPLTPGRVLYVGEAAAQTLRSRLDVYLVDFRISRPKRPKGAGTKTHKGAAFVLEMRDKRGDAGVYVRWVEYGASEKDIHILEASLINYLNPQANDRVEEYRHEVHSDDDRLDRRLIR